MAPGAIAVVAMDRKAGEVGRMVPHRGRSGVVECRERSGRDRRGDERRRGGKGGEMKVRRLGCMVVARWNRDSG